MGGKQAKPLPSSKAGYYPDVEVVQAKHIDPHYGEVRYVRDKRTNQLLVLKEIIVNTKQAFDAEADFLHHRVALKHPNVVEIIGFNTVDQTSFCASSYKISVYIEVQEKTLQAQLNDRIFNRQAYTEGEVTHVAECLISALSYFQNKGHNHGDIRPANIFVKANTIKLSDPTISSFRGANALTLVALHGQKCFLAPELLGNILKRAFDSKSDKHKADVWSTGVTLLALASLSNCEDLYNYKLGSLNEGLLAERLNQVRGKYSPRLYDLIRSMLTLDERVRPDFATLAKQLNVPQPMSPTQTAPLQTITAPITTSAPQTVLRSSLPSQYIQSPGVTRSALPTSLNTPVTQYVPTQYAPSTYTTQYAPSTYTTQYLPSNYTTTLPTTTEKPAETTTPQSYLVNTAPITSEVLKRSALPATYTTQYVPSTYTSTLPATTEGLKRSVVSTTPYTYTVPSTYATQYVPGTYTSTLPTTTEGLKRSWTNLETVKRTVLPSETTTAPLTTTSGVYSSYPAGTYTTAYPGTYSTAYPGAYTTAYPGTYTTAYPGAYTTAYPGYTSTLGSYGLTSPLARPVDATSNITAAPGSNANVAAPGSNANVAAPGSNANVGSTQNVGSVKNTGSAVLA